MVFDNVDQTNVTGTLTIQGGACGTKITLNSDSAGNRFELNATGAVDVDYAKIKDSAAVAALTADNSSDAGNNTGWTINATACTPSFEQSAYRLYAPADSVTAGAPLAANNTDYTLTTLSEQFRLRALIHVSGVHLGQSGQNFRLEFAERGVDNECDTSFTNESYAEVTGATEIGYFGNSTPNDGDDLGSRADDPTHDPDTVVDQDYEEANNFTNSVATIPDGQDGNWDFSLVDNTPGTSVKTFCFRIRKSDGSAIDTVTVV